MNEAELQANPIVKWVGGKRQLQDRILPLLLEGTNFGQARYYEPFFGGGALLFALRPPRAAVSDLNKGLINLYQQVLENPTEILEALKRFEQKYNALDGDSQKSMFILERQAFNQNAREGAEMAARFVFLNKAGFNGMYRENSKGEFNIPFGQRKKLALYSHDNILAVSKALKGVEIKCQDYAATVSTALEGDVVYFDPPYAPLTATSSFTGYTAEGFDGEDQRKLRDLALSLTARGVRVILSNSSARHIFELYKGFRVQEISASRAISASAKGRAPVTELLITNFEMLK